MRHGAPPPPGVAGISFNSSSSAQATMVGAAGDALASSPAASGVTLLPRVLGDSPIAVLLIDRTSGQVTYANAAALELAGEVALPVPIEQWSKAAGVTDVDGTALGATSGPLSLVAAGKPVAGEPVRVRGTASIDLDRVAVDRGLGPVVWATGFPLGPDGEGDQLSLVVFLPVEQPAGVDDPEQVLQARYRSWSIPAAPPCHLLREAQDGDPPALEALILGILLVAGGPLTEGFD